MRLESPLRTLLTAATLGCVTLVAACASDRGPPARDPHKDSTLFISPAGKPFHADPGQTYPVGVWFREADINHDGRITREEFRADFQAFFEALDVDHDGMIDGLELGRYENTIAPEILPRLAQAQSREVREDIGDGSPAAPRRELRRLAQTPQRRGRAAFDGAPEFSLLNVSEPVSSADMNFDGKVSLQEFLAAADRRFSQLDSDKQGSLTLAGLPQTPEQILVEGKRPRGR
jgi:hypothetical protein